MLCTRPPDNAIGWLYLIWAVFTLLNAVLIGWRLVLEAKVKHLELRDTGKLASVPLFLAVGFRGWARPEWGILESAESYALFLAGMGVITFSHAYTRQKQVR
jgi:hypothetical protein